MTQFSSLIKKADLTLDLLGIEDKTWPCYQYDILSLLSVASNWNTNNRPVCSATKVRLVSIILKSCFFSWAAREGEQRHRYQLLVKISDSFVFVLERFCYNKRFKPV